jgi:6-phosphofructokinase 1
VTARVAITITGGPVPGLNSVIAGVVLAAGARGWDVVGIQDGFDGLLFPGRYPAGGVVELSRGVVEHLAGAGDALLGVAARSDPFHVRTLTEDNAVEEVDRSADLLGALREQGINAVIAVADAQALATVWKLHRQGLHVVCVPKSLENDMACTRLSFGFNSALSFTVETLDRARQAALAAGRLTVVEVPGDRAGWLALQAGMAVCADVVLIPEIPYDLQKVSTQLRRSARPGGLVVVAEGAKPRTGSGGQVRQSPLKAALSPGATDPASSHVIEPAGHAADVVALELQRLTDQQTSTFALGALVEGGTPTAVDRQLGLAYGAAAVRGLQDNHSGVTVAFNPPDPKFVPLAEAINNVRSVPADHLFIQIARSLGISLGE